MQSIIKTISIIFLIVTAQSSWGQFKYSQHSVDAQMAVFDLDFNKFNSIKSKTDYSESGLFAWLTAYKIFVNYKTSSINTTSLKVADAIKNELHILDGFKSENQFYYYCKADLYFMLAYVYFESDNLLSAFNYYLKAKGEVIKYQKQFPDFKFVLKHELLLLSIEHQIETKFPWAERSLLNYQQEYLSLLKTTAKIDNQAFVREIKLLGTLLSSEIDAEQLINIIGIDNKFCELGPIETYVGATFLQQHDYQSASLTALEKSIEFGYNYRLNLINLAYGNALLNKQQANAIKYLNNFLEVQQSSSYVNFARYKAAEYYFLYSNKYKTDSLVALIALSADMATSEDKQAKYEITHYNQWTRVLLVARKLFDAGDYHKALNQLLENKELVKDFTQGQRLEYAYRLGRIYDKLGNIANATTFYNMAIRSKLDSEYYYPIYAAYYLGMIYKNNDQILQANQCFQQCLQLDSPVYKTSIHKKAQLAIIPK